MPKKKSPRKGSLQFWPRKRSKKFLHRVNWDSINSNETLKGFICHKAGMASALVKDNTPDSLTKGKERIIPITLLECPPMKIFSVRFYKDKKVNKEILINKSDKELKRKLKIPKSYTKTINDIKPEEFEDVRILCYSIAKKTKLKKKPDLIEIGISGSIKEKIEFVKKNQNKELSIIDFFKKNDLVDTRGLTKGKGFSGPVKRFGIKLRAHKSEKGIRKVGSIAPWNPSRITFRAIMAGQLGMFNRVFYNKKIIDLGKAEGKFKNIKNYGNINSDYMILSGSVQGSSKRQLLITKPLRKTKKQDKKNFELIEIRWNLK